MFNSKSAAFFHLAVCALWVMTGARAETGTPAVRNFAGLPLSFEANQGQAGPAAKYLAHGQGYTLALAGNQAAFRLDSPLPGAAFKVLRMTLDGADPKAAATGLEPLPGKVNYLLGNDPSKWVAGAPTYRKVGFAQVYSGIDVVYYGNGSQLEYDFDLAAGVDPGRIKLGFAGGLARIADSGELEIAVDGQTVTLKRPIAYQMEGARRIPVESAWTLAGSTIGFRLGAYNHARPLTIDPVLVYSTYLSGAAEMGNPTLGYSYIGVMNNWGPPGHPSPLSQGIAVDGEGNLYVTGSTNSINFPLKDAYDSNPGGAANGATQYVAFVSKFNPAGTELVYSTYLGGTPTANWLYSTEAMTIAVDAGGNAYVGGVTQDPTFPSTPGAYQTKCGPIGSSCAYDGFYSGFLTKLDPTGQKLVYSTFLGESEEDIWGIAVDGKGQAYVTGQTWAPAGGGGLFPTTADALMPSSAQCPVGPGIDNCSRFEGYAFLTVFNAAGGKLLYSTLLGDSTLAITKGTEKPSDFGATFPGTVALDPAGNVYVAGYTMGRHLPISAGALQGPLKAADINWWGGWVAKFKPIVAGSTKLVYLTYLAGPSADQGTYPSGIAADAAGNAYVSGWSSDAKFPTTAGAYQTACRKGSLDYCQTAFVAKINASGTALDWSTMLSGENQGAPNSGGGVAYAGPVLLDAKGNVYVGGTSSPCWAVNGYFPLVHQIQWPDQTVASCAYEPFVSEFDPTGSELLFSTFFGSTNGVGARALAGLVMDKAGNLYLAGNNSRGGTVPTTKGVFQPAMLGAGGGYLAKIALTGSSKTVLSLPSAQAAYGQTVKLTATVAGPAWSSVPTGYLDFTVSNKTLNRTTLNGVGKAVFTLTAGAPGVYTLGARYEGDETFSPSAALPAKLTVVKAAQTIAFPAISAQKVGSSVTLKATASSKLAVSFVSLTTKVCTVTGASAKMLSVGTCTIEAQQAGNANYIAASPVKQSFQVAAAK